MRNIRIAAAATLAALALAAMPLVATARDAGVSVRIGPLELRGVHGLPIAVGRIDLGPLPLPPLILPFPLRIQPSSRAHVPDAPIYDERDDWYPPPGHWQPDSRRGEWRDGRRVDRHDGRHDGWDNDRRPDRRDGWRDERRDHSRDARPGARPDDRWDGRWDGRRDDRRDGRRGD